MDLIGPPGLVLLVALGALVPLPFLLRRRPGGASPA
jgi:hypothetical protein